jgi:beta-galactosidase
MALFMGVLPSKGEIAFDDIEIKTEPGVIASLAAEQEALPPRVPLERIRESYFIDLSQAANRALADDEDNDGKGGWSDQGRAADMRNFKSGERKFGGVPFKILDGAKAIVVLRSSSREPDDLPAKVTIPVGRKLDTLFFLHASAWSPEPGQEGFRYVIHYKDGKTQELPVTGDNIADWISDPVKRFQKEEKTFSTVAQTVPVEQYTQGSVYRMEWNAPTERRGVEIDSIEFIGNGVCVPILLGITGVTEY